MKTYGKRPGRARVIVAFDFCKSAVSRFKYDKSIFQYNRSFRLLSIDPHDSWLTNEIVSKNLTFPTANRSVIRLSDFPHR